MKKVLLLGDSIRGHYQTVVQKNLGKDYAIYFPWENGRFSAFTLNSLQYWLYNIPAEQLDVIHWNNGLWDVAHINGEDACFCDLDTYLDNMERIYQVLRKQTNAKIILATITPTRKEKEDDEISRHYLSDIKRYNEALIKKFEGRVDAINDLYSLVIEEREKMICDDYIHPTEYGKTKLAEQVCKYITQMK